MIRVLVLGGTGDALEIARRLGPKDVYSLAGLGKTPEDLPCGVRVGGYGGASGLARYVEAERIGLISLTVDDEELDDKALEVATRLSKGAPSAIRWTKNALNNWFRMAGPSFDASVAYEMLGLTGPEVREGVASHREKRAPNFDQTCKV